MKISKDERIILLFGFLVIIIYICKYLDINKLIQGFIITFSNKEEFTNPFKPNKIFRYHGKIYLLDTRNILEKDKNPKVFNNFKEYQEFIMNLEKEFNNDLKLKINKESDINNLDLKYNYKNDYYGLEPYSKINECNKRASLCSFDKNEPYYDSVINNNIKGEKEDICNINLVSDKNCKDIENIARNERKLTKECEKLKIEGKEPTLNCKKLDFYKHNGLLLKEICHNVNKKMDFDNYKNLCLIEDHFRENMLEFEI